MAIVKDTLFEVVPHQSEAPHGVDPFVYAVIRFPDDRLTVYVTSWSAVWGAKNLQLHGLVQHRLGKIIGLLNVSYDAVKLIGKRSIWLGVIELLALFCRDVSVELVDAPNRKRLRTIEAELLANYLKNERHAKRYAEQQATDAAERHEKERQKLERERRKAEKQRALEDDMRRAPVLIFENDEVDSSSRQATAGDEEERKT